MYRNFFNIALRNLFKNKISSFINIAGLAVGMAVAMLIGLWIWDELTFDTHHKNYDRIVQVMQHQTFNGEKGTENSIPFPLTAEIKNKYGDDFKYLAMASWGGDQILTYGDKIITREGNYMDKDITKILSLEMQQGSQDGLKELHSILLAESTAKALFDDADPMGKLVKVGNENLRVTGVFADLPFNTSFHNLTFIAPWELYVSTQDWIKAARDENQWDNNSFQLFAQIADQADVEKLSAKIKNK
jgi:hypothetical protein